MYKNAVVLIAIAVLIAGCGGGGSNTSSSDSTRTPPVTPGQAQGVYMGTSSNGYTFESIILPNDKYYAIYGTVSGNVLSVYGMMTGQGTSKSGTYTADITDFYYNGTKYTGSLSASYVVGSSLNGTITETGGAGTVTFTGAPMPSSQFNYNAAATLSHVTGTWAGEFLDGTSGVVSINSDGTFAGSNSGCSFTGTISPDSSGKNFFNVSVTFGGSPCLLPGQTASGIAVESLLSDGVTRQLLFGGTYSTYGTLFIAQR